MKKLGLVSTTLATLFTLSIISACNNDNSLITNSDQIENVNAQAVKKVRAKMNLIKHFIDAKLFIIKFCIN